MKNTKTCPLTRCAEYFNRQQVERKKQKREEEKE